MDGDNAHFARLLRQEMTWAEKVLWFRIRNRKIANKKFRRQQPFGLYILDFYCVEQRLNIEIDGGQHDFPEHKIHDQERCDYLRHEGVTTLRFWNSQIRENIEGVLAKIRNELEEKKSEITPSPDPLPSRERE